MPRLDVLPGGVREVAQRLGLAERTAYAKARGGELPFVVRVGRRYIVPRRAFEAWLETAGRVDKLPDRS